MEFDVHGVHRVHRVHRVQGWVLGSRFSVLGSGFNANPVNP
jgi:hypothetical protein